MADTLLSMTGQVDFRERLWEFPLPVPVPFDNPDILSDINLSLFGHSSPWNSSEVGNEADDVRVYWNDREITSGVLDQLKYQIDQTDQGIFAAKLKLTFSRYINDSGKMGFPPDFNQIASTRPFSALLTVLGDGTPDNIFNFLYRDLPIQPISMLAVLQESLPGFTGDWSSVLPALLTFSSGPCRFYTDGWEPSEHPVAGGITYNLGFRAGLSDSLARIEELVGGGPGGTIQAILAQVRSQIDNLSARIEKCDTALGDVATLQAIQQDLAQIKANLLIV